MTAEVVRSVVAGKSGKPKRQSFFRFTTPGHHPFCDYANPDATNAVPETLVAFSESRSNLTRAVRDLVCTGIEVGSFSRSEEHTSELQSQSNLVCRLLLEKKKFQRRTSSTRARTVTMRTSTARTNRT